MWVDDDLHARFRALPGLDVDVEEHLELVRRQVAGERRRRRRFVAAGVAAAVAAAAALVVAVVPGDDTARVGTPGGVPISQLPEQPASPGCVAPALETPAGPAFASATIDGHRVVLASGSGPRSAVSLYVDGRRLDRFEPGDRTPVPPTAQSVRGANGESLIWGSGPAGAASVRLSFPNGKVVNAPLVRRTPDSLDSYFVASAPRTERPTDVVALDVNGDRTSGEIGSALEPQGHDAAASDRVVVVMRPGASSAEVLAIWRSLADSHSGFVNAAGFTSLADDQTLRAVLRLPAIEAGQLVLTAEVAGIAGADPSVAYGQCAGVVSATAISAH